MPFISLSLAFLVTITSTKGLDMTNPNLVAVVGLNSALQKRFVIDTINQEDDMIPGNVYRASSISYGVGGKGQDVAYTLNCLQYGTRYVEEGEGDRGEIPEEGGKGTELASPTPQQQTILQIQD